MPPKGKKQGVIIDGVDTTPMTREQLEKFALTLKEENDREREERNFFQMERDKLRTFWEITRNELEEARAKLRNKDRQIEEEGEKNEANLKEYTQQVKHLELEQQNSLTKAKTDYSINLENAINDHLEQEKEIISDKRDLKIKSREQELSHQEQIRGLKYEHSSLLYEARQNFETKVKETEMKYEKMFQSLKQELNTKHRMEMNEVEERKNTQLLNLTKNHDKFFNDMKNYYNDITLNNLALINSLKDQMESLRTQNERMTKQVADLIAENRKLVEPLAKALADLAEYKRLMQNYGKDKISLANTKLKLSETKKKLDELTWVNMALELRFDKLQVERDELHKRFVKAIMEVQQKSALKSQLLTKRIETLNDTSELQDAMIGKLAQQLHIPEGQLRTDLGKILSGKNTTIKDLQYELARVCKAHDDLLETYEEKLLEYGVPKQELGFQPLKMIPEDQAGLAKGPAGLVTRNK